MTTRGLVIGAGGTQGLAWSSATLAAIEQQTGWDPRSADVFVGTSQGALLVSLLAYEIGTTDLVAWYRKELPRGHPLRSKPSPTVQAEGRSSTSARRSLPTPGSPGLVINAVRRPTQLNPLGALAGLAPAGRSTLDAFMAPLLALSAAEEWAPHPATWVTAVDYSSGERVCFGTPDAPDAGIQEAVRASCSVPGVFPAVDIAGRSYVDGGVHSSTSLDLVLPAGMDEVVVLAPMAGRAPGPPWSPRRTGDFLMRKHMQRKLDQEAALVSEAGTRVHLLTPSSADLAALGINMLSPKGRFATFEAAMRSGPDRVAAAGLA